MKSYYAIRKGRESGVVVTTWRECHRLVAGYPGAIYKGFLVGQREQAERFAKYGEYPNQSKKKRSPTKRKAKPKAARNPTWNCIERKSYRDPTTGVFYKNRCVRKKGPMITGSNYHPEPDATGVPWD